MATTHETWPCTTKGGAGAIRARKQHLPPEDGAGFGLATYTIGMLFEKNTFPIIGGPWAYDANSWTIVTGGTGDAQAEASTAGGGVLITAASDDNFDTTLTSVQGMTPTTGKRLTCLARFQVSDATGIGFYIGLTTGGAAAALPFGTNYTDAIAIRKAIASATITGHTRGNSGTAVNTTLGTGAAATEVEAGFEVMLDGSAGQWFYNGVVTDMTATELAQVLAILTTPPTMYATLHVTGVTATNPTLTVTTFLMQVDL